MIKSKFIMQKALFAGMMIGIGALAYARCDNNIIGAFLFSFGLLSILNLDGLLYTGRVGYLEFNKTSILSLIAILCFNIVGISIIALLTPNPDSTIFLNKLNNSLVNTFISSIFCGIMMYLAVELFKKKNNPLYVIMAIMIFIISGFDHCIANMYYYMINPVSCTGLRTLWFFIINILGNSIGSIGIRFIINPQ